MTSASENTQKEDEEVRPCIQLGGGQQITVGRNKSGKPWKKTSSQSAFKPKKLISKTYERRMEEAKKMKAIQ